ncbi:hypothetical protein Sjap_011961 [Stephania japonica]|uniref:Uncharacterized protein n=1 Tax=Stephania japonica TaxID=461633 RepID=A0AAP0JCD4_9MAGN
MRTSVSMSSSSSAVGSSPGKSNYSRRFDFPDALSDSGEFAIGGAMLPIFLNDLRHHNANAAAAENKDFVEVTLELEDDSIVLCSVTPTAAGAGGEESSGGGGGGFFSRSVSASASKLRRKFSWLRSSSSRASLSEVDGDDDRLHLDHAAMSARDARKIKAKLQRSRSSAQQALKGLRFISKTTGNVDSTELWKNVESRFFKLSTDGFLSREDFGECIGMTDSKEFALGMFDALARRKRQKIERITKEELYDFWLQISDHSFDARLQIFFDMADSNEDGRITRDEVQELIMLSASANKLSKLKEQAEEYASLIMEELDPENLGYIELWQLEALLLQRDNYMNYSRPLSTTSNACSQNNKGRGGELMRSGFGFMERLIARPNRALKKAVFKAKSVVLENWQRAWIVGLWMVAMGGLFGWKFFQYRKKAAFQVMGYCVCTAKGAAETLKLNMALVLLPVCRNTLTWLRSTRARLFVPFDDNINFHKTIAVAIAIGVAAHAGTHLVCDFPRLVNAPSEKFALLAGDFNGEKPSYKSLLKGVEGVTGIAMVLLLVISFTLASHVFRKNVVRLPSPFNRLTGFNAFWYSHHLTALVYVLLFVHGYFVFLVHQWYKKTVSVLPGNVFSLIMSKPSGFKYKSGQYIFIQCQSISPFEWHPFSITSASGDDHLSVHIRTVGDWTDELKRVFTETCDSPTVIGRARFGQPGVIDRKDLPKIFIDGPYGAPAQDYRNYDVLLLVGLGIGATPFISILRDLLNSIKSSEEQTDSNTETSRSEDSLNSYSSSSVTPNGKKRTQRTTNAHFYWGVIEMHNYLTSVYEEGDARSTLLTMVQALNHAKHGVDILSGTRVRTHFARPNWREVFTKIALKHPYSTVGVFYCGMPVLAKELKKLAQELSYKTSTRFEFHKEYF